MQAKNFGGVGLPYAHELTTQLNGRKLTSKKINLSEVNTGSTTGFESMQSIAPKADIISQILLTDVT